MRSKRRKQLAGIQDAVQHGRLNELPRSMARVKPLPKTSQDVIQDPVRGKQKQKGSSKVPSGWYSRGMFS